MTQTTLTIADELDADSLWAERPPRPVKLEPPIIPAGAAVLSITCRACGARDNIAIEWNGLLCGACRANLPATLERVSDCIDAANAAGQAHVDAWLERVAALPDDLAERWENAMQQRQMAEARLERATTGRGRGDRLAQEREARAALEAITAKFERAATNPDNPLREMVLAERAYQAELRRLEQEKQRWLIALQEIDAAGGLPF